MSFKELGDKIEGFNEYPLWGKILSKVFIDLCEFIGVIIAILYAPVLWIMYGISKYQLKKEKRELENEMREFNKFLEEQGEDYMHVIENGKVVKKPRD